MTLVDMIMRKIRQAAHIRYKLIVVTAPFGGGKTHALATIAAQTGAPVLDLHSVISGGQAIGGIPGNLLLVDNAETLSDPAGIHDSLRSLLEASRRRVIVVALGGKDTRVLFRKRLKTRRTGR